jgi:hypothetical protein
MMRFGESPYLECSSKGDKRFSAFYAYIGPHSIEELYQRSKVFEGGVTGLHWRQAKGMTPINVEESRRIYSQLWDQYFALNPHLYEEIDKYKGFSDIFGQEGHACQAEEIYRIWKERNG